MKKQSLAVSIILLTFILAACEKQNHEAPQSLQQQQQFKGTIVAVGDSLTAGLGVNEEDAYPSLLQKKLQAAGIHWRVVNAGISGETTSGVLSRVKWILKLSPDIVILETGANDGLRGVDPRVTRRNIDQTIAILKQNKVIVVLGGMRMVTNMGREFTEAFTGLYPALARKHGLILVPFSWRAWPAFRP